MDTSQCFTDEDASFCDNNTGWVEITFAFAIMLGMIVSFIPQYINFIKSRSSEGVSYLTVFLGSCAATFVFLTSLFTTWSKFHCFEDKGFLDINEMMIGVYQLFVPVVNYVAIFSMLLVFFPSRHGDPGQRRHFYIACGFFGLYIVSSIVILITGVCLNLFTCPNGDAVSDFNLVVLIITVICTVSQWLPQLWTTFRTKTAGELSIVMLIIQSTGSLLIAVSEALDGESWEVYVPYLVAALEMFCLIFVVIYYDGCFCFKGRGVKITAADDEDMLLGIDAEVGDDSDDEALMTSPVEDNKDDYSGVGDIGVTGGKWDGGYGDDDETVADGVNYGEDTW